MGNVLWGPGARILGAAGLGVGRGSRWGWRRRDGGEEMLRMKGWRAVDGWVGLGK